MRCSTALLGRDGVWRPVLPVTVAALEHEINENEGSWVGTSLGDGTSLAQTATF